jgi:hypothetical protein
MSMKNKLRRMSWLRVTHSAVVTLRRQFGFNLGWIGGLGRLIDFRLEYRRYRQLNKGSEHVLRGRDIQPCLLDRTEMTPIEPIYFYQDTWLARKLAGAHPSEHVDVGSSAKAIALIAQFLPVTMVDIRPVDLSVPGFNFLKGTLMALPFTDGSVGSLSSICVIEHIGLGRYGDPLDAHGTDKAALELVRVLARGGDLYVTVPVAEESRVAFNAHRTFTREHVLRLFAGLELVEERYVYGREWGERYLPARGFGTGLFHFKKQL